MNRKELNNKPLYELRCIGRHIGVKAASSLSKSDLIEKILEIENGITTPTFTNKGRPSMAYTKKTYFNPCVLKKIDKILNKAKEEIISLLIEKR